MAEKEKLSDLEYRLSDPEYQNFIKACCCLSIMRDALEAFAYEKSVKFHQQVLDKLEQSNIANTGEALCTVSYKEKNKLRVDCQHLFCNYFVEEVIQLAKPFRIQKFNLKNSNHKLWHSDPWELSKLFMTVGVPPNTGPRETDLSNILAFLQNCPVENSGNSFTKKISEVREIRNRLMHSANMTIDNDTLESIVKSLIAVLEIDELAARQEAQKAVERINEVMMRQWSRESATDTLYTSETLVVDQRKAEQQSTASIIPPEFLRQDGSSIKLYKKALADGIEEDYNIRLMVVGPTGVGKTTFIKRLLGQPVNLDEPDSTDGIDVHVGKCKISLKTLEWVLEPTDKQDLTSQRIAKVVLESAKNTAYYDPTGLDTTDSFESSVVEKSTIHDSDNASGIMSSVSNVVEASFKQQGTDDIVKQEIKKMKTDNIVGATEDDHAGVSVWDFGGQFIFYTTHQMFLTHRAIYILVINMSQHIGDIVMDDDPYFDCSGMQKLKTEDFLDIWLHSIHGHSNDEGPGIPPIVLVGTHSDKLNPENKEKEIEAVFDAIRDRFAGKDVSHHFIEKDFGLTNAANDPKLADFKQTITELAKKQSYWGENKPAKWIPLEKRLEELRCKGVQIISRKQLNELNHALPVPITDDKALEVFLRFEHDSASIMYFRVPELRDKIVLNPHFLVNALKSLITAERFCKQKPAIADKWKEFRQKGILKTSLLDAVWDREENTQFQENREHILKLMEHLNIIAKPVLYTDEEDSPEDIATKESSYYLVPCMLKESPPEAVFHNESKFISTPCLCLVLGKVAFPGAIFHRLVAKCMSHWPLARKGNVYLIYCGCGQFDVDLQHRLTLSLSLNVIALTVTRYSEINRHPDVSVCQTVCGTVKEILKRIGERLSVVLNVDEYIRCPLGLTVSAGQCMHSVKKLKEGDDFACHEHDEMTVLHPGKLLKYWFDSDKMDYNTSSLNDRSSPSVLSSEIASQIPDEKAIAKISKSIGKEYQQLAQELGIKQACIEQIIESEPCNVINRIRRLLLDWKKRRGCLATYDELEKAMKTVGIDTSTVFKDFLE